MLTNSTRVKPLQALHLRDMASIILLHKVWLLDLSIYFFKTYTWKNNFHINVCFNCEPNKNLLDFRFHFDSIRKLNKLPIVSLKKITFHLPNYFYVFWQK